jgi:steroid delta-isomerase-like uncharacterized protein
MKTQSLVWLGALAVTVALAACGSETREPPKTASSTETTAAKSSDANKALVKKYFDEVWAQKNPEAVKKYFAADLVNHAAIPSAQGAEGLSTIARKIQKAFPDHAITVETMVAEDDIVIARVISEGTHKETLEFAKPIEATNKHMKVAQVHTFRIKDGKVVETWMVMDKLDLLTQLGQMPPKTP